MLLKYFQNVGVPVACISGAAAEDIVSLTFDGSIVGEVD